MTNTIIKEIHSEFSQAEEQLLKDVQAHLQKAADSDKEQINALASLGFSNFREKREISPEEIAKVEKIKERVTRYKGLTNIYKFITDEKVIEICQKYGLIHGPVNLYTDSIPKKNQEEIMKFNDWASKQENLLSEPVLKTHTLKWQGRDINEMTTSHILNTFNFIQEKWTDIVRADTNRRDVNGVLSTPLIAQYVELFTCFLRELFKRDLLSKEQIEQYNDNLGMGLVINTSLEIEFRDARVLGHYYKGFSSFDKVSFVPQGLDNMFFILVDAVELFKKEINASPEYTIVAAKHMMDLSNHDVNDKYKVIERVQNIEMPDLTFFKDDDPIVLYRVNGGYFIVSAWGDEAADENIVNHNLN